MRIKLKKPSTGKIKYVSKPDGYPVKIGDEIRFRQWSDNYDVWLVVGFWSDKK